MNATQKVLSCHRSGNFIPAYALQNKQVTPEEMDEFLAENDLVWTVSDLGPWLGMVAMFYKRNEEFDDPKSNEASQPKRRTALGNKEFTEMKKRHERRQAKSCPEKY
ncbi:MULTISPECIES: hypothetical protein [unclassified Enterococcus]|uniref:hypothetical protein n=1 Tax=unclassified Enterococcus TaxID=2608891 RepID=UPI0013EB3301|nr:MULTISPECIES: hypothetical protein [unclassified Enterococcus]